MGKLGFYLKNFDWIIFSSVLLLASFGLLEIYSVALGQEEISFLNFQKQIFFVVFGVGLMFLFALIDYNNLKNFSNYFYIAGVLVLLSVLFFGETIRGTRGWFYLWGFGVQPVEFIKIILILFLAKYFSGVSLRLSPVKHLVVSGFGFFVLFFLVLMQPDFGSALILFSIWFIMLIVAGFNRKYFVFIFIFIFIFSAIGWGTYLKPYQKERILTFLNPTFDPLNQGYNVAQAIIAVGSGGITGRGIGFGSQSQLKFLPESQNDFILAVVAEELGFFGVFLVLLLFGVFYFRCLLNLRKINDDFGSFFILGVMGLIFVQMFINIGMNLGMLPVVGISLPFLSYGGSHILSTLIMVGIIESVVIRSNVK